MKDYSFSFIIRTLCLGILLASCHTSEPEPAMDLPDISTPADFEVSMLYSPSANGQGSWVSLTTDDKGRLISSDQYGRLYRITVEDREVKIDSITLGVGHAQGLLWAHGGLYVSVNAREDSTSKGSGVYKLTDTNGDDAYDQVDQLITLEGEGEHGPHAIILGPDGESIFLIAGNHTLVPEEFSSVLDHNWERDRLFASILDPRGHANSILPPGGWIARSDDRGQSWKVIASGFRNAYDIAFNREGDLFTFDSDMEWDLGTPWYRPTRVCHVIPGAEFGWRTGSGKWPSYYPDNLPAILDVGQGSPTGVVFGYSANFPAAYRNSLFVADWSFGTIYQVDLTPNGASYTAQKKEFLSGTALAITDMVIGKDGNMYFTTGGRRGTSYLYQVRYTGDQGAGSAETPSATNEDRQTLRTLTEESPAPDLIWGSLTHEDRFIRYAARVALEKMSPDDWKTRFMEEQEPTAIILSSIAGIRTIEKGQQDFIASKLMTLDGGDLPLEEQLSLVRAWALYFIRNQTSDKGIIQKLPAFPSGNPALDRELAEILAYLQDGSITEPALELMEQAETSIEADLTPVEVLERSEQYGPVIKAMHENRPAEQGLSLAMSLSHLESGWTDELRDRYFRWFYRALQKSGGMSYTGFVERVRLSALENVPARERERLAEISGEALLNQPAINTDVPPPAGPGRNWIISEALQVVSNEEYQPDVNRGHELYQGLLCASCHAINGEGGNVGPDLTQAGTRFSRYDLLMAMISPSVSISDQYGATLFTFRDGSTLVGRIVRTTGDSLFVNTNPFSSEVIGILRDSIESEVPSPVSLMPGGLINRLNEDELRDLMAYLVSEK